MASVRYADYNRVWGTSVYIPFQQDLQCLMIINAFHCCNEHVTNKSITVLQRVKWSQFDSGDKWGR